jgi:signal transduction histidine kinase
MKDDRLTGTTRAVTLALGCLALVAVVAYIDYRSSAYIAFSIFYVVPIAFAAWYGSRWIGVVTAVASGLGGFAADIWASTAHHLFAWVNLGLRLVLFTLVALMISRIKETREREHRLAELEREAMQRLQELNDMKDALMRSVIVGAREPLGDIYARIVTLGFDLPTLSVSETRAVLAEIADASRRLSTLVNNLVPDESEAITSNRPAEAPTSSLS